MNHDTRLIQLSETLPDGAPAQGSDDLQFGRRIEADRSWTVYHVFTGVPARSLHLAMTGLNLTQATDRMMRLNRRIDEQFGPDNRERCT